MTYVQECLEKFQELPSAVKEKIGGGVAFNLIKELEKKYDVSLSFLVVLLAIGELDSEDIFDYITSKYKLKPAAAKTLSQEIETKILDPVFEELVETEETTPIRPAQEKELILRIFSEGLRETLQNDELAYLQKLNILIFKTFQADNLFEDKIINIFYNNPEILTSGRITLNGNEVQPAISNWLKDFISENGNELFSNIILVKYLSDNQNVKKLKEAERVLIKKLLKLYRNLVFFPESLENVPLEEWEIFPIDWPAIPSKIKKIDDVLAADSGGDLNLAKESKTIPVVPRVTLPVSSRLDDELADLMENLKNYSASSLEYKALSQEISRLKTAAFKRAQSTGRQSDAKK